MLKIIVWDVQHGSSTYIRTPNGKHIVIDLGSGDYTKSDYGFSPLQHLKNIHGIKRLDKVIITHPHADHIDDIMNFDLLSPRILRRPKHLSEEYIRKSNQVKDKLKVDKYIEINQRYSQPVADEDNPIRKENNGGVSITHFSPTECGQSNINNHSIVTIIEYLGVKVVIPGDNESTSWKELLELSRFRAAIADTNIFVASHHGRESGYCGDLFEYFKPNLVVISDGASVDTSATDKYSKQSKGWGIYKRSENELVEYQRKCLTTRKDGTIEIKIGSEGSSKYMNVTTE